MLRRRFTKILGMGAIGITASPVIAAEEIQGQSGFDNDKVPLGVCNHSLRSMRLTAQQLIQFAIDEKLDAVLLNTLQPFESVETSNLQKLKKIAEENKISIYIGAGSVSEKSTKFRSENGSAKALLIEGIRVAIEVGSPIVGCRIGNIDDRYVDGGIQAHMESVIKVMKSVKNRALDAGVKFAFENHAGDLRASELLAIIEETGTDICGALFDPANAAWALEDPMEAFKLLKSNIVCTSVRDIQIWETNEGAIFQGMAIGEGVLDFQVIAKTMAEFCPGVPLHVETISNSARPVPFLKPGFMDGFPNLPASEMVGFLKLIKRGKEQKIIKPPKGTDKRSFDIKIQQAELLKSFDYLRKNCNVGLKS